MAILPTTPGVETFFHAYRNTILPTICFGIPAAAEAVNTIVAVAKEPGIFCRNFQRVKSAIKDTFTQRPEESFLTHKYRMIKNTAIAVVGTGAAVASVACSFAYLPTAYAIPAALVAINACAAATKVAYTAPKKIQRLKNYMHDSFSQRPQESTQEFHARRTKAIVKITLYSSIAFGALGMVSVIGYYLPPLLKASPWDLYKVLPDQTKLAISLEYATLGLGHALLAIKNVMNKNYTGASFHIFSTLLSAAFPIGYSLQTPADLRLHHSFIGLALQLTPWRAVQSFGLAATVDSSLYFFFKARGYFEGYKFTEYDLMNIVVDNFPYILTSLTAQALLQRVTDTLLASKDEEEGYISVESITQPLSFSVRQPYLEEIPTISVMPSGEGYIPPKPILKDNYFAADSIIAIN